MAFPKLIVGRNEKLFLFTKLLFASDEVIGRLMKSFLSKISAELLSCGRILEDPLVWMNFPPVKLPSRYHRGI
jgi:hypothetical protein